MGFLGRLMKVSPEKVVGWVRNRFKTQPVTPAPVPATKELPEWEAIPHWRNDGDLPPGWNIESVAEAQNRKWPGFIESLHGPGPLGVSHEAPTTGERHNLWAHNLILSYAYVLALAAHGKQRISLLDWGGGAGHYYPISRAVMPGIEIDYSCHEVPALCELGRKVLPGCRFSSGTDECFHRTYDLVMAGSSLWYEYDWRAMAGKLAEAATDYLYITRMMFVQTSAAYVAVQRPAAYGYNTEYQCWILNQEEFLRHLKSLQMELVREFIFGPGPVIASAPEPGYFKGFLFRRHH